MAILKRMKWLVPLAVLFALLCTLTTAGAFPEKGRDVISLPAGTTIIGPEAFSGIKTSGNVIVPEGVTTIGEGAFADSSFTVIELPATVTEIQTGAFRDCGSTTEKTKKYYLAPAGVTVGAEAFDNCQATIVFNGAELPYVEYFEDDGFMRIKGASDENLEEIVLPGTIEGKATIVDSEAFADHTKLKKVVLSEGMNRIHYRAFGGCTNLTDVTFPSTLTRIDEEAFKACGSNAAETFRFDLPDGITEFGPRPFLDCPAVLVCELNSETASRLSDRGYSFARKDRPLSGEDSELDIRYRWGYYDTWSPGLFDYVGNKASVVLPDDCLNATDEMFREKPELELVCSQMSDTAKALSKAGVQFTFPGHEKIRYRVIDGILFVMRYAGDETEIVIPKADKYVAAGVDEQIRANAFNGMEKLKKVVLPEGVTRINSDVFTNCFELTDITFPKTLKSIDQNAFRWCGKNVTEPFYFVLPNAMEDIAGRSGGATTFSDVNAILVCGKKSQTAALLTDRNYAYTCPNELDFRYRYESYTEGEKTGRRLWLVGYTGNAEEVTIPKGIYGIKVYDNNTESSFYRTFYGFGFNGNETVKKVVIPEGTVTLLSDIFTNCYNLTDITFPSTLKRIDQNAFRWCGKNVTDPFYFVLPDNMTDIAGNGGGATTFSDVNAILVCGKTSKTAALLTDKNYVYATPDELDFRYRYESYKEGEKTGRRLWLVGYTGNAEEVTIPKGIYGIKLYSNNTESPFWRTFYGYGFNGNETVKKVVIPEGTVKLLSDIFTNCYNLTDITFPSTLKEIDQNVFRWCGKNVTDPFYFVLPDNMTDIVGNGGGATTFSDVNAILVCGKTSKTAALLTDKNYTYTSPDELNFRYRYESYTEGKKTGRRLWLVGYIGTAESVTIPDGIYGIKLYSNNTESPFWRTFYGYGFYGNETVKKVVIPEGTVVIEDSAFRGCVNLTSISFPDSLKVMKNHAFEDCGSASTTRHYYFLPDNMTEISTNIGAGWGAFTNIGEGILVCTVGSDTSKIVGVGHGETYSFAAKGHHTDGLLYRYLKYETETEGEYDYRLFVWKYIGSAKKLSIPDDLGVWGVSCPPRPYGDPPAFYNNETLEKIVIPKGVEVIEDSAFSGCTMLSDITLPSTLRRLANHAFERTGAASGKRFIVVIPASVEEITAGTGSGWDSFNESGATLVARNAYVRHELYEGWYVYYQTKDDAVNKTNLCYKKNDDPDFKYRGNP